MLVLRQKLDHEMQCHCWRFNNFTKKSGVKMSEITDDYGATDGLLRSTGTRFSIGRAKQICLNFGAKKGAYMRKRQDGRRFWGKTVKAKILDW